MTLALRFLSGPRTGATVPLDDDTPLLVGRRAGAGLVVDDESISRRHARLAFEAGELTVEDLGSANGTWLNGVRVRRARAGEGDRLLLGGTLARVVALGEAPEMSWPAPELPPSGPGAAPAGSGTPPPRRTARSPEEPPLLRARPLEGRLTAPARRAEVHAA